MLTDAWPKTTRTLQNICTWFVWLNLKGLAQHRMLMWHTASKTRRLLSHLYNHGLIKVYWNTEVKKSVVRTKNWLRDSASSATLIMQQTKFIYGSTLLYLLSCARQCLCTLKRPAAGCARATSHSPFGFRHRITDRQRPALHTLDKQWFTTAGSNVE